MHHYGQQYAKHVGHNVSLRPAIRWTRQTHCIITASNMSYTPATKQPVQPAIHRSTTLTAPTRATSTTTSHPHTARSCTGLSPRHHVHLIMHRTVIAAPCSLDHAQDCHHSTMFTWSAQDYHHSTMFIWSCTGLSPCSLDHAHDCHHSTMFTWSCTGLSSQHHVHLIMHRTVITAPCSLDHAQGCQCSTNPTRHFHREVDNLCTAHH